MKPALASFFVLAVLCSSAYAEDYSEEIEFINNNIRNASLGFLGGFYNQDWALSPNCSGPWSLPLWNGIVTAIENIEESNYIAQLFTIFTDLYEIGYENFIQCNW